MEIISLFRCLFAKELLLSFGISLFAPSKQILAKHWAKLNSISFMKRLRLFSKVAFWLSWLAKNCQKQRDSATSQPKPRKLLCVNLRCDDEARRRVPASQFESQTACERLSISAVVCCLLACLIVEFADAKLQESASEDQTNSEPISAFNQFRVNENLFRVCRQTQQLVCCLLNNCSFRSCFGDRQTAFSFWQVSRQLRNDLLCANSNLNSNSNSA